MGPDHECEWHLLRFLRWSSNPGAIERTGPPSCFCQCQGWSERWATLGLVRADGIESLDPQGGNRSWTADYPISKPSVTVQCKIWAANSIKWYWKPIFAIGVSL